MKPAVASLFMSHRASTWDPGYLGSGVSLSADRTLATFTGASWVSTRCTLGRAPPGKHYFEVGLGGGGLGNWMVGLSDVGDPASNPIYAMSAGVGWRYDGKVYVGGVQVATWATFGDGDTICVAVDLAAELVWLRKAGGLWNNSAGADPAAGAGGLDFSALGATQLFPTVSGANSVPTFTFTPGQGVSAPPAGFYIWE